MAIIEVSGGGSALQDAINSAKSGDIINVVDNVPTVYDPIEIFAEHSFNEDGTLLSSTFKSNIRINAINGPNICIIDASNKINSPRVYEDIKTGKVPFNFRVNEDCRCIHYVCGKEFSTFELKDSITFSGFTLNGGHVTSKITQETDPETNTSMRCWTGLVGGAAVYGPVQLTDCIIENCTSGPDINLNTNSTGNCTNVLFACFSAKIPQIRCIIRNNKFNDIGYAGGFGKYSEYSAGVVSYSVFDHCIFTNNIFRVYYGGSFFSGRLLVSNCTFWKNTYLNYKGDDLFLNNTELTSSNRRFYIGFRTGFYQIPNEMNYQITNNIFDMPVHVGGTMSRKMFTNNFVKYPIRNQDTLSIISTESNEEYEDSYIIIKNNIIEDDPMLDENLMPLENSPCKGKGASFGIWKSPFDVYGKNLNYPRDIGAVSTEPPDSKYNFNYISDYREFQQDGIEYSIKYVDINAIGNNSGDSWENAYNSISMTLTKDNTIILVKPGIYSFYSQISRVITASSLNNIIIFATEGPLNTIIDLGNINTFTNCNGSNNVTICGFTIKNGFANNENIIIGQECFVEHCVFTNCDSSNGAPILKCKNIRSSVFYKNKTPSFVLLTEGGEVNNCIFENIFLDKDRHYAVGLVQNPNQKIKNCRIYNTYNSYGAAVGLYSTTTLENCEIIGNIGDNGKYPASGGAVVGNYGNILSCNFIDNIKIGNTGGAVCLLNGEIKDSNFIGNFSNNGGGAIVNSIARNCIFERNCSMFGGASNNSTIYDSIFKNNIGYFNSAVGLNGTIINSKIYQNKCVHTQESVIYSYLGNKTKFKKCNIYNNIELFHGYALLNQADNCKIYNNYLDTTGMTKKRGICISSLDHTISSFNNLVYDNYFSFKLLNGGYHSNSTFINNSINYVYLYTSYSAFDKLCNCIFKNNKLKYFESEAISCENGIDYSGKILVQRYSEFNNNIIDTNAEIEYTSNRPIGPFIIGQDIILDDNNIPTRNSIAFEYGNSKYLVSNLDLNETMFRLNPTAGCYELSVDLNFTNSLYPIG